MGADLWYHQAPWHPDPLEALHALQAQFVTEHYNLHTLLPEHLQSARQALQITKDEGDPYDILRHFQKQVTVLARLISQPIPTDPMAQVEVVREVSAFSGQGAGNVLDVTAITEERDLFTVQRLSPDEILRAAGSECPTTAQAEKAVFKIHDGLGRGECVCFPIYDDRGEKPIGWYFVGNTVD